MNPAPLVPLEPFPFPGLAAQRPFARVRACSSAEVANSLIVNHVSLQVAAAVGSGLNCPAAPAKRWVHAPLPPPLKLGRARRRLSPRGSLHSVLPPRLSGSRFERCWPRRTDQCGRPPGLVPLALGVSPGSAVGAGSQQELSGSPTLRGASPPPDRPDAVSPLLLCPHHPELYGLQPLPRQPMETQ